MNESTNVELVDEVTGEPIANVTAQIITIPVDTEELKAGVYFAFPNLDGVEPGTKIEVFLHGPYDDAENAELAAGEFLLKSAEDAARKILGEAA